VADASSAACGSNARVVRSQWSSRRMPNSCLPFVPGRYGPSSPYLAHGQLLGVFLCRVCFHDPSRKRDRDAKTETPINHFMTSFSGDIRFPGSRFPSDAPPRVGAVRPGDVDMRMPPCALASGRTMPCPKARAIRRLAQRSSHLALLLRDFTDDLSKKRVKRSSSQSASSPSLGGWGR
jgi:hypothetical protein